MEGLEATYAEARLSLGAASGRKLRAKPFRVTWRPFAGLRGVIYDRRDHFEVRLGEILRDAPVEVHRSLAAILVAKIDRRLRLPRDAAGPYRAWSRTPAVAAAHEMLLRRRARPKRMRPPRGDAHDLAVLFDELNREHFGGSLPRPLLGWSPTRGRTLYGHHDPIRDAVVVNCLLDHPRVPTGVVAAILFHEMLHIKHGVTHGPNGRRVLHSAAFRRDEAALPQHGAAQRFLRHLEARRIRLRAPRGAAPRSDPQALLSRFGLRRQRVRAPPPPVAGPAAAPLRHENP